MIFSELVRKSMNRFRSVVAAPLIVLLAAPLLAGCMETMAQSMVESDQRAAAARLEAGGNPVFTQPELQAASARFDADYRLYGTDPSRFGAQQGVDCKMAPEKAFELLRGMSVEDYRKMQRDVTAQVPSATTVTDLKAVKLVSLSGPCGPNGPEGPAVLVGTFRDVMRIMVSGTDPIVSVMDSVARVEGSWAGGKRVGAGSSITMTSTTQLKAGEGGKLQENVNSWAYLNEITNSYTGAYLYSDFSQGKPGRYTVSFIRNPVAGTHSTTVVEALDARYSIMRQYFGRTHIGESRMRDQKFHGWSVTLPYNYNGTPIPSSRTCYQDGVMVKALDCPSS